MQKKKTIPGQENTVDQDNYAGKKDEYGGTMTGTGYGEQAKKGKMASADDKKYMADDDPDKEFEKNADTKGFDEGQGQGSGYGEKQQKARSQNESTDEFSGQSAYGEGYTMGNRSGRASSDQGAGKKRIKPSGPGIKKEH